MRFKLDENLPVELVTDLRGLGHDADTALPNRILFTLDKGIANLQRYPIHQHAGVVLFRLDTSGRRAVIAFVRQRLHKVLDMHLAGRLTVVGPSGIRFR